MILLYGLGFATSFIIGRWADGLGKERVLTAVLAELVPALAGVPLVTEWTALLVICLVPWGVLQSLAVTLLSTLLSECSERHRGTVLAFYSLVSNPTVALGAALLAPLFTSHGFTAVGWACAAITPLVFGPSAWMCVRDKRPRSAISPPTRRRSKGDDTC
ncbi:MFS transporter [Streptomyces huasconensis]|uniref:MFS transporter n=1 Tax=Streptomyces huasconensis TaxID=1854574 RepID=A0ABV3LWY6_9ACTN